MGWIIHSAFLLPLTTLVCFLIISFPSLVSVPCNWQTVAHTASVCRPVVFHDFNSLRIHYFLSHPFLTFSGAKSLSRLSYSSNTSSLFLLFYFSVPFLSGFPPFFFCYFTFFVPLDSSRYNFDSDDTMLCRDWLSHQTGTILCFLLCAFSYLCFYRKGLKKMQEEVFIN